MLPNELLLDILHFVDYETLVIAKLAGAGFLSVAAKFAEELPRRRDFQVTFYTSHVSCQDSAIVATLKCFCYEVGDQASLADACRKLNEVIGPHAVDKLLLSGNSWNMPGVGVIFETAPPLKYAEVVGLFSPRGSRIATTCDVFMNNFDRMKTLHLSLDYDFFSRFSWTFLCQESARELRVIKYSSDYRFPIRNVDRFAGELVRYCAGLPPLPGRESLQLDFSGTEFSVAFCQRIIRLLKNSGHALTFRTMTPTYPFADLVLDISDYTVDVDGARTSYTAKESGIVIEVEGFCVSIHNNAHVS